MDFKLESMPAFVCQWSKAFCYNIGSYLRLLIDETSGMKVEERRQAFTKQESMNIHIKKMIKKGKRESYM